ncbi:hypothetical protein L873DRAFT_1794495 [Choiromyces venosus 120613-1]|uniref:Uncharacterized protein n=1 Tax=Choiromyces venosus 120613-1 TaxID=1336337 RepID=A0A3N4J1F6_9PEZI|nr:hypothetical protein L873DRAFT_1794495 [Choiromyces venosus 120613-1]
MTGYIGTFRALSRVAQHPRQGRLSESRSQKCKRQQSKGRTKRVTVLRIRSSPYQPRRFVSQPLSNAYVTLKVIKTLLAQEDVNTDTPDNFGATPLSLAFSGGHNQIVKMLQERISRSSGPAHDGGQAVAPQSVGHGQEHAAVMLCGGSDLGPEIADLEGPNANLSTNPKKRKRISGYDE